MKTKFRATKKSPVAAGLNPLCYMRVEMAAALRLSERTVDRMIRAGEIEARHIRSRMVRIPRAEAERVLNGRRASAENK